MFKLQFSILLSIFLLLQVFYACDSRTIRQLGDGEGFLASIMPLISAIASIPSSALRTTINMSGASRANNANAVSSFTTSNGFGATGVTATTVTPGNTVANGGVAIIRRGSELLADQLVGALGGAATLIGMLESYEQNGQVYLNNIQSSVQGITNRLTNTAYNGADVILQQLGNQSFSSPGGGDIFFRRGSDFTVTTARPVPMVAAQPVLVTATQTTMPQDGFGFPSGGAINGDTLVDMATGRDVGDGEMDLMGRQTADANSVDGLSSVLVNAASPFGTYLENSFADGTINNRKKDGVLESSLGSFSAPVQQLSNNAANSVSQIPSDAIRNYTQRRQAKA